MAPVSGIVVGVKDDEPDIEPGMEEFTSNYGNYIWIQPDGSDSYLILAHLRQGSIRVAENSRIELGMVIAQVGNSGTTSEPHLHIQYQKNDPRTLKQASCAEGLPLEFSKREK